MKDEKTLKDDKALKGKPATNHRPLDDPSYEPGWLYNLLGKPGLGTGTLLVVGIFTLFSIALIIAISIA